MKNVNPLHITDFYKHFHIKVNNHNGLQMLYSNFTPRSTKYLAKVEGTDNKIVCFGLQYFIKYFLMEVWQDGFFKLPKEKVLKDYQRRVENACGPGTASVKQIGELHDLGYLPILIKALPEGALINERVPYFTICNTDFRFAWLQNFLEDALSCLIWRASTAATIIRKYRLIGNYYAEKTGVDKSIVDWIFHDFSLRGCSGIQDSYFVGGAFLLFQKGTDNVGAIDFLEEYYGADSDKEMVGGSCAATEHACVMVGGKDKEFDNFKYWITELAPTGILSLVSDTWNIWNVITNYLPKLKQEILARNGKVVIRPDSSPKTPLEIICGDPEAPEGSPENKGIIQLLWDIFGGTVNSKGYKELDSHIGCIYGEAIQPTLAKNIFETLEKKGFAMNNIFMGVGSGSFVLTTRDTMGFACKATYCIINNEKKEIWKDPITDSGTKKSAKGLLRVDKVDGEYILRDCATPEEEAGGELKEVFRDGKLLIDHTLAEIRARVNS